MPRYNYARFLTRCASSILDQQGVNVRVLIIDDASSDDTPQVGQRLAALDPRVEFRRHEVNCGHLATCNEGLLGWASAKYSLLLSADDMLAPAALARATRLADRHGDVGMTHEMALLIERDPRLRVTTEMPVTSRHGRQIGWCPKVASRLEPMAADLGIVVQPGQT